MPSDRQMVDGVPCIVLHNPSNTTVPEPVKLTTVKPRRKR